MTTIVFLSPVECCVLVRLIVFVLVFCFLCVFFLMTPMCILLICCITQSYRVHIQIILITYVRDAMLYPLKDIYLDIWLIH